MEHVFACGLSRSGTTLLTTIIDSHPEISMGYEILPPARVRSLRELVGVLQAASGQGRPLHQVLRDRPETQPFASYLTNCNQARNSWEDVVAAANRLMAKGIEQLDGIDERAMFAMELAQRKRKKEGTLLAGFKLNSNRIAEVAAIYPDSAFVRIVRHPYDVAASQLRRGFDRSVPKIAVMWSRWDRRFRSFEAAHPDRAVTVRYEDLVTGPEVELGRVFAIIGLPYGEEVRRFYESGATIHRSAHNNAEAVGQALYQKSVGRGSRELGRLRRATIKAICGRGMRILGYR